MSNLMNTAEGRNALLVAQRNQLERRLSRFFHRTVVIDFSRYQQGLSEFDLNTMLGALNAGHDQEIIDIYRLLGAVGGLDVSVADTTYFVNPLLGSDQTGTGSSARPYASLWFLNNLPRRLNHRYRVVLLADYSDPDLDLVFDFSFGGNGSLALIGSGMPTVIMAATPCTGFTQMTGHGGHAVDFAGPLPPVADQYFLEATSGPAVNCAVPIHSLVGNAAIVQSFPFLLGGFGPGDSVRAVAPGRNLHLRTIYACCTGSAKLNRSQLVMVNLGISFETLPPPTFAPLLAQFNWENTCSSSISFVRFDSTWNQSSASYQEAGNSIKYGSLNSDVMLDHDEILTRAACGVLNLDAPHGVAPYQPNICGAEFCGSTVNEAIDFGGETTIVAVDLHCRCIVRNASIHYSNMGIAVVRQSNASLNYCVVDGQITVGPGLASYGGVEIYDSIVQVNYATCMNSDNFITCYGGSRCRIIGAGADPTYCVLNRAAIWLEGINTIEAVYVDPASTPVSNNMIGGFAQITGYTKSLGEVAVLWGLLDVMTAAGNSQVIVTR